MHTFWTKEHALSGALYQDLSCEHCGEDPVRFKLELQEAGMHSLSISCLMLG